MEEIIKAINLKKSFNKKAVLKGIDFTLYKNENIVLLGKSGDGKTVLMKMLIGLIDADEGQLDVLGRKITTMSEQELISIRQKIGYIFQDGALYDSMTVGDNVAFSLERQVNRKSEAEIERLVKKSLERVGLLNAIDKMPNELSGGMKKRVALARILVMEPEIILYDEPTSALDPVTSKEIIRLILDMKNNYHISSIIATHDMICAKMTADKIMILHEGKISAVGTYDELERSETKWVEAFFK